MIRVVHILTRPNIGGPAAIVVSLCEQLDKNQFSPSLLFGDVSQLEGDFVNGKNMDFQIIEIPGLGRRINFRDDLRALFFIAKQLREIKPHIVHTHMAKAGALGRIAAIIVRVPIRIHTYHGHLLTGYFGPKLTRLVVLTERFLSLLTTYSIVVGENVRRDLLSHGIVKANKSESVAPGIPLMSRIDKIESRIQLGLPLETPVIMLVGRLAAIKRPDIFVELASRLMNHPQQPTFAFVGDGPLADQLRQDTTDLHNLIFLGWQRELNVVYSAADFVVLCSDNEGMPLSLIEASSLRVPIVAFNVGSVSEIVIDGTNGVLVEAGNIELLYEAVVGLMENSLLQQKFSDEKLIAPSNEFSIERSTAAHAAIYQRLYEQYAN